MHFNMNDIELVAGLKEGRQAALEDAIQLYSGYVMAVLRKTLNENATEQDREELLTDVFVALWKNREKLREDSRLKFWLAVVARNGALQYLRKLHLTQPLEENSLSESESEIFAGLERKERIAMVRHAVTTLPEEEQDIFLRHYFWKQTVAVIAEDTGINASTIKSRLARGRKKLKAFLIKEDCTL